MSAPANDVDAYLTALPEDARVTLETLRRRIRAAAPHAVEVISYRVPTFKHHGGLVGFAAFKDHCSFFVMSPLVMDAHKDELSAYDTAKGTVHFPVGKPLPAALVKKLVKARIAENEAADAQRRPRRMASQRKPTEAKRGRTRR
ncbi:MAG: DUF1801 domain-containing protein [Dehalococcoidia bacterium]